jgi:ABC-type amino acid transport substrate-binding protein
MQLEVFDPCGSALDSNKYHYAPRLADLKGKTIGEISNRIWESDRIFPLIRDLLNRRFPNITFVPYTEFPSGADNISDNETIGDLVAAKRCDAVIGSSAA